MQNGPGRGRVWALVEIYPTTNRREGKERLISWAIRQEALGDDTRIGGRKGKALGILDKTSVGVSGAEEGRNGNHMYTQKRRKRKFSKDNYQVSSKSFIFTKTDMFSRLSTRTFSGVFGHLSTELYLPFERQGEQ